MSKQILFLMSKLLFVALANLAYVPLRSLAADLDTIRQRGHFVIAVKEDLRPLGFRDAQGRLQGLEIDIARRLAEELLGRPDAVVFKPVTNAERLRTVVEDKADLVIAQVTATVARSRVVSFSVPYYRDGTAIVTKDPTIQRVADLENQTIAALDGSSTVATLRYRVPGVRLMAVASYQEALAMLERGDVPAFAADATVLAGWVQEYPAYRLLQPTLSVEPLAVVLPKGLQSDDMRRRINVLLNRWRSDGWLQERAAYWGLPTD